MARASSIDLNAFTPSTRATFQQYVLESPNNRRVSQSDKGAIIGWLTNPRKRPSSQKEFSRRNYVQKSFILEEGSQLLLARAKTAVDKDRIVVTEDMIIDVVESVHNNIGHAGWDATWKAINTSYYGVPRSDLIFLLRRCQICARNPSKRPKSSLRIPLNAQPIDQEVHDFPNSGEMQYDFPSWYALANHHNTGD